MLILNRKRGDSIIIGDTYRITVASVDEGQETARFAIELLDEQEARELSRINPKAKAKASTPTSETGATQYPEGAGIPPKLEKTL